jgi:hypothetical protein
MSRATLNTFMGGFMKRLALWVMVGVATIVAGKSWALGPCTGKINTKDGGIRIAAHNVLGTLTWGEALGQETNTLANCTTGGTALSCDLGPTGSAQRITPPALCTVYMKDSAGTCSAYLKGCTPGLRATTTPTCPLSQVLTWDGTTFQCVDITSSQISAGAVGNTQIAAGAVDGSKIAAGAVGATQLATGAVGATQLAAGAVGTTQLAAGAVGTAQIATGAVGSLQIAAGAVGSAQLAAGAVGTTQLAAGAVDGTKLAAASVSSSQIVDGTITTADIGDAQITIGKLAADARIPAGTVVPFAGSSVAAGWLLCDGSPVSRSTYAGLFGVIGTLHGSGDGVTTFNVPDYRGRFLRGVDGTAGRDPDNASRTAMNAGGSTGNAVGSVQGDAFQGHKHDQITQIQSNSPNYAAGSPYTSNLNGITGNPVSDGVHGTPRTSYETRPTNAYINWIIKY